MKKCVLLVGIGLLLSSQGAFAGLLLPHVLCDSIDIGPQGFSDIYYGAYWQKHVYLGGWYDEYGDHQSSVWAIDASDPYNLAYIGKSCVTPPGSYKTFDLEAYDNKLYGAYWGSGVAIYDITNGNLVPAGSWDPPDGSFSPS